MDLEERAKTESVILEPDVDLEARGKPEPDFDLEPGLDLEAKAKAVENNSEMPEILGLVSQWFVDGAF